MFRSPKAHGDDLEWKCEVREGGRDDRASLSLGPSPETLLGRACSGPAWGAGLGTLGRRLVTVHSTKGFHTPQIIYNIVWKPELPGMKERWTKSQMWSETQDSGRR